MADQLCPEGGELRDWFGGRLPIEVAERLFAHLDDCPRCQAQLQTLSDVGDTLVDYLRQPRVRDELQDEPQLWEAVARAKAIGNTIFPGDQVGGLGEAQADIVGQLGEYEILEKLAEGGMGTVYKALHTRLGRVVALKFLPAGGLASERAIARFDREMQAVGQLDHPHIVRALDAREVEGRRFLVLEYVDGADLSRLVHRRGPLPVAEACELVCQAAVGLQYAHDHELIHRDVKPSNLIVDQQGQLKILDLGLARLRLAEPSTVEMTGAGQIMGTAEYMAPEQASDAHCADVRADVYGLGCTLYYLLVGRPPYPGKTAFQILTAHHQSPIPSLCAERSDIPQKLDGVFHKMVAKRPAERYASMTEVIADLTECLAEPEKFERQADPFPFRPAVLLPKTKTTWRVVAGLIAGAIAATILLDGLVIKLNTRQGTLIFQVDQQGAEVIIDDGKITITTRGDSEPTVVQLKEGEHTLTVRKGGFETRTEKFTITSHDHKVLDVSLVPRLAEVEGQTSEPAEPGTASHESEATIGAGTAGWLSVRARTGEPPPLAVAPFSPEQAAQHQQAWAAYLGMPVEFNNALGMKLVLIPPGEFLMGSSQEEQVRFLEVATTVGDAWAVNRIPTEGPPHPVRISEPFYLGKYEVTQSQWEAAIGHNPASFKDPDNPVENVSWNDTRLFIERLNGVNALRGRSARTPFDVAGMTYVLPTEAQWEYACRAGTTTAFYFGDSEETLGEYAWHAPLANKKTHAVGQLKPNAWALHDMHGNVWEWCADWYAADYYTQSPETDPCGPAAGSTRMFRSGSWGHFSCTARSAFRRSLSPDFRYHSIGFRLALVFECESRN